MRIREIMTRDVHTISPDQSIRSVARIMARIDSGALLVNEGKRLVGMVTDRDIAVRAVARGLGGRTPIRRVMSHRVRYCFDDEDVRQVASHMADIQLRRLPVLDRDRRLVGVVSMGNIASLCSDRASATLLYGVTHDRRGEERGIPRRGSDGTLPAAVDLDEPCPRGRRTAMAVAGRS